MKCFNDEEGLKLFGNFDTSAARSLLVTFEKCDPEKRNDCKSEQEITDWLSFKYIIVHENKKRFIKHKFNDERIEQKSKLNWYAIS